MLADATDLPSIALDRHVAGDLVEGTRREWLATTGRGDYALGTPALLATRRYHGLLVAASRAPVARLMLVPFIDETVRSGRTTQTLATRRWTDGSLDPDGRRAIASFRLEGGTPTWTFECGAARIEKRLVMLRDARGVALVWTLVDAPEPIELLARVFVAHRTHHAVDPDADWLPTVASESDDGARARIELPANRLAPCATTLHIASQGGSLSPASSWWRRHLLAEERARGYDAVDSSHHALDAAFVIEPGRSVALTASLASLGSEVAGELAGDIDAEHLVLDERVRRRRIVAQAAKTGATPREAAVRAQLAIAADDFVVARATASGSEGRSIIAGFPWFEDWGRDAMIALPGLLLATGRAPEAQRLLDTFADALSDGLLPNRFPDLAEEPEYHSADAPLLFLIACCRTFARSGDRGWLARIWPAMRSVVAFYARGTRHGIGIADDGLVVAGDRGLQLTWMDAKVGDLVVTPRMGKPVELSALWIDALRRLVAIAPEAGDHDPSDLAALAARAEASFGRFWNPATQCLFDVLDGPDGDDPAIRPNQLFALAAAHSPLPEAWRSASLARVDALLSVPLAVRTLPPASPGYRGRCEGDQRGRDLAYHMGTAWPFLEGLRLRAERLASPARAMRHAQELLEAIDAHFHDAGLGSVSEILDGDAPHEPRGCPMQAWSVGALLEAIDECLAVAATEPARRAQDAPLSGGRVG